MFGAIAGGIASALAGGAMSKLFGGGQKAASGGIQGDVLATDNKTVGMGDAGIKSANNQNDARYGFRCCHLKNIWTAPLPPETELSRQMTTSTTSIDIMGLQAAYANLHTDQERDYFMQRYHDVISSFGGKTSYDADNRPLLVMRSNLWA